MSNSDNSFKPTIGKTVIETLTLGMYENPRFIFREYIQNSADQIDVAVEQEILNKRSEGIIQVVIDDAKRIISIEDNATGIEATQIRRFLGDVANSTKDVNKRKGFRGIGRLGGLGYCKNLVFETSYKGEAIKSTMILDATSLKKIINNNFDNSDAASVISVITKINNQKWDVNDHFFRVTLLDVTNDLLLDRSHVLEYLSMVAPVPFSPKFSFRLNIKKHLRSRNLNLDEYVVKLNGHNVFKAYKDFLSTSKQEQKKVISIGYFDVENEEFEILATGWYGIYTEINKVIDEVNIERGIRIRKNNIAIGNEQTLFKQFPADRTNLRYIGEVHTISDGFRPNARRDYFNDNKTVEEFEKSLRKVFADFEKKLPHQASDLHNRLKSINDFRSHVLSYKKSHNKFKTKAEQEQKLDEVLNTYEVAKKAVRTIEKIRNEATSNNILYELYDNIVGSYGYRLGPNELEGIFDERTPPPWTFSKVTKEQEIILNEVVQFLQEELGYKEAEPLLIKLSQKYNDDGRS